ncbi:unnamed protein product [Nesidiocoris tenuis]|uniref:Uncharacterized protein n=1 Tax=Nesidiocoris tenuis TaxID=355587 RepID=A0A6H5H425_9HEMI|nr:unnamed protein product [Nesidiocoris tenuis]
MRFSQFNTCVEWSTLAINASILLMLLDASVKIFFIADKRNNQNTRRRMRTRGTRRAL